MRAGFPTLGVAIIAATAAVIFALRPFDQLFHHWAFAVAAAIAGLALLAQGVTGLRPVNAQERFASFGGFGGALLCAAMVSAAFAVGPPHQLGGSPGQITPLRQGERAAIAFPMVTQTPNGLDAPDAVELLQGGGAPQALHDGDTRRTGQYVLAVSSGPLAFVRAQTPDGRPVTVTQPEGASFASPYLLFPGAQGEQRLDYFAVPPLHRTVNVAYYASYRDEARGIVIPTPFVLVQINEENGAQLYRGATVSGHPIRAAGMVVTFTLGRYPAVTLASAPALVPLGLGILMLVAGLIGYAWCNLLAEKRRAERPDKSANAVK
ncbi:MAG: hypothetical protein JOY86_05735 [Candidatus Eremiobacteraeota bacterium]|nr:hypothetical protein [Candidatus Eremiobacteraeota bacterium]